MLVSSKWQPFLTSIVLNFFALCRSASQLGIGLGEAHVIRNAGGSAYVCLVPASSLSCLPYLLSSVDALRSIIISQRLLGTREIAIVRHTNCGMLTFTTDQLRKTVKDADPKNATVAKAVDNIDFLEFSNLEESVKQDVNYLRENPLVLTGTVVTGWVYDVRTGGVRRCLCFSSRSMLLNSPIGLPNCLTFSWCIVSQYGMKSKL